MGNIFSAAYLCWHICTSCHPILNFLSSPQIDWFPGSGFRKSWKNVHSIPTFTHNFTTCWIKKDVKFLNKCSVIFVIFISKCFFLKLQCDVYKIFLGIFSDNHFPLQSLLSFRAARQTDQTDRHLPDCISVVVCHDYIKHQQYCFTPTVIALRRNE